MNETYAFTTASFWSPFNISWPPFGTSWHLFCLLSASFWCLVFCGRAHKILGPLFGPPWPPLGRNWPPFGLSFASLGFLSAPLCLFLLPFKPFLAYGILWARPQNPCPPFWSSLASFGILGVPLAASLAGLGFFFKGSISSAANNAQLPGTRPNLFPSIQKLSDYSPCRL